MQRLSHVCRLLSVGLLLSLLSGCMAFNHVPRAERDPVYGLGQSAARLLDEQAWTPSLAQQVLLLAPPEIDNALDVKSGALNEALTRALLALKEGPQVLNWHKDRPGVSSQQWRLEVQLDTSGGKLLLSDRTLQPYQLTLNLSRRAGDNPLETRHFTLSGAFDQAALEALSLSSSAP